MAFQDLVRRELAFCSPQPAAGVCISLMKELRPGLAKGRGDVMCHRDPSGLEGGSCAMTAGESPVLSSGWRWLVVSSSHSLPPVSQHQALSVGAL